MWRVVHSSLPTPPPGCGNLEIRPGIARRAIRAVGSGSAPRPPRSLARAPGDGLFDENQLAVDAVGRALTGLPALEVGYREVRHPIMRGRIDVVVVVVDPVYFLDLVRLIAVPRLHSAEDDVSDLQICPVVPLIIVVAEVVVA